MRVIIVGNSPELLKATNGHLIDSFDFVVRMNHYEIDGYQKYVGTKTDIYATAWATPKKKPFDKFEYIIHYTGAENIEGYTPQDNEILFTKEEYKEMQDAMLFSHYDTQPSLGAAVIFYFLKYYPNFEIYITGFDYFGFKNKDYTFGHYYEEKRYPRLRAYMHHEPDKEMEYVDNLIANNKIKEL